jgi:hypothetical protein
MRLIDMPQHIIGSFARLERKKSIYLAPNTRPNIACTAPTAVADLSPDQPVAGDLRSQSPSRTSNGPILCSWISTFATSLGSGRSSVRHTSNPLRSTR